MTKQNQDTGKNLVLDAALDALARGWSVMPISRTSKNPLVKWSAYTEEMPGLVKVKNWFGADYPDANLGLITGELSQVVVLDCDDETGLEEIERRGGVPETLMVQTRPDIAHKLHFYFQHPGFAVGNFQKKCGEEQLPGLDFRGDGGYVMLPPSVHHSGAGNYAWLNDFPIAPCPTWLTDVLRNRDVQEVDTRETAPIPAPDQTNDRQRNYVLAALEKEREKMMACSEGQRHQQRYNSAMALAGYIPLLSEQEIIDALSVNFGKSKQNALETIADGIRNGKAKPRQLPANVVNGTNYNGAANGLRNGHQNGSTATLQRVETAAHFDQQKPNFDTRELDERGLTAETITKFKLLRVKRETSQFAEFDCYEFPTWTPAGRAGRARLYSLNPESTGGVRYLNDDNNDGARLPMGYNLFFVCEQLAQQPGDVWVLGDEFSVWLSHQAGLMAVSVFSFGADPAPLIRELKKRGATKLHLCLGTGDVANTCALKASYAALKAKVPFTIRTLPIPRDGAQLWELRDRVASDKAFANAVLNLQVWGLGKLREMAPDLEDGALNLPDPKGTKAEKMLELLENIEGLEVFHTELGDCYLSIPRDQHTEVWPLPSGKLSNFCRHHYHRETGRVIDGGTVENVLGVLHGRAQFEGALREVPTRCQEFDGRIYIDLCNEDWEVIEIGEDVPMGWRIIQNPPVAFRRAQGMEALPTPQRGGKWEQLKNLLGLDGENWILAVSWLVMALRPGKHPFPVLAVHGEQESGKSTLCKMLRTLVDPNFTTLLGTSTRDEEELMIRAKNSYVVGFDNLSKMAQWLNDALCSLVTEGSFAKRSLYSNDEEALFKSQRPVILNGINESLGRNDFRRRCVKLILPQLTEERKREEEEAWAEFHIIWPKVLGLLCDALCCALINLPSVELPHRRGLVDFAKWICAAEPVLPWEEGQFAAAYLVNQQKAIDAANEADSFILAIIDFIDTRRFYKGGVNDFRIELSKFVDESVLREPGWPKTPSSFGEALNRVIQNLRAAGIIVTRLPRRGSGQMIDIRRQKPKDENPSLFEGETTEEPTETEADTQEAWEAIRQMTENDN